MFFKSESVRVWRPVSWFLLGACDLLLKPAGKGCPIFAGKSSCFFWIGYSFGAEASFCPSLLAWSILSMVLNYPKSFLGDKNWLLLLKKVLLLFIWSTELPRYALATLELSINWSSNSFEFFLGIESLAHWPLWWCFSTARPFRTRLEVLLTCPSTKKSFLGESLACLPDLRQMSLIKERLLL